MNIHMGYTKLEEKKLSNNMQIIVTRVSEALQNCLGKFPYFMELVFDLNIIKNARK